MAPTIRREKTLTPKRSAMYSYVKLMRHPQHWYFPQFRCNMRKISAKRYRRAKLNTVAVNARTVSACWLLCHHLNRDTATLKRYCLLGKAPSHSLHSGGITYDNICNNALFHTTLARQRSINVRISMIYLYLLYGYLLLRNLHVKCGPPADRLDCRISIKMDSQPCGGTIANTVRVFTASNTGTINM